MTNEKKPALISTRYDLLSDGVHAPPSVAVETLCTFDVSFDDTLLACPSRPFKPKGLLLWDVPGSETVRAFIGTDQQNSVSFEPVPARWFTHWRSFAEIARATSEGHEPPGWGEWSLVRPGLMIRLVFSAPIARSVQAVMWGHTVRL